MNIEMKSGMYINNVFKQKFSNTTRSQKNMFFESTRQCAFI